MTPVKAFLKEPFNKWLVIGLLALGVILILNPPETTMSGEGVHFFYSPSCPFCAKQKPMLMKLEANFPNVKFYYCLLYTSPSPRD
mgnify:CR=1 FL=1